MDFKALKRVTQLAFQLPCDWMESKLSADDISEILREDPDICDESTRLSIVGYPSRPVYRELSSIFATWIDKKKCPVLDLPNFHLLDEHQYNVNRAHMAENVTPVLLELGDLWDTLKDQQRAERLQQALQKLGKRGILDCLGMRKTVGTVEVWPPPRRILENTFNALHKPDTASKLSVGARALSKHCHRDETNSWWGKCTGKETEKNDHASGILKTILDRALWINIHTLPHDVVVIETREEHGYGLRWTADGEQFRGFLEPQMEDGHDVGWKH